MISTRSFNYSNKVDKIVVKATAAALKVPVLKALRILHGEVNHAYEVTTDIGNMLVRVFRYSDWPEDGKLKWIEKQLSKNKIPHAKILYYSRSSEFFPHGFMISEFLEGSNGHEAVKKKQISLSAAFYETGKALKQVHRIELNKFGVIPPSKNSGGSFVDYKIRLAHSRIRSLEMRKAINSGLWPRIEFKLRKLLQPYNHRFFPVLVHGDPNRENAIWTTEKQWVFVDWDNAFSGSWLEDYCDLTYWAGWARKESHATRIHALITKNFFLGYGSSGFSQKELLQIEKGIHIFKATGMLTYYLAKKSPTEFNKSRRLLFKLLK